MLRKDSTCRGHHGLVNDRADAKGDVDAILDQVHATLG